MLSEIRVLMHVLFPAFSIRQQGMQRVLHSSRAGPYKIPRLPAYIAKNSSSRGEQNGSSLCGWANGQQFCQKLRHSRAYASKAEQSRIHQRWLSTGLSSQPLDAICVKRKDRLNNSLHIEKPIVIATQKEPLLPSLDFMG